MVLDLKELTNGYSLLSPGQLLCLLPGVVEVNEAIQLSIYLLPPSRQAERGSCAAASSNTS